ncbi:hypothetical protein CI109_104106 [Kwoniella shandongensis]|uniref:Uncharacterized protein n=1 Tax=Kwoniella shandongensis TaxID=1734106 RepID=A0A5M6C4V9_9TREE|nr:uncharacterized protein CI109_002983 [Kwoniella shandongensis]KAA5528822.1 hypothetical protein CI109_002983 [Kwoniella shandongensis]
MERSSSQRDLRVERLSRTPYSRPEPSKLRKSVSASPFATLKSIVNYVSSPFSRGSASSSAILPSTTNDVEDDAIDIDRKSESGSEDNWTGSGPNNMGGQDVFSLAAAGGRQGQQFEDRAADWRARGEKPGGRRELARLQLEAPAPPSIGSITPTAPGHFDLTVASNPDHSVVSATWRGVEKGNSTFSRSSRAGPSMPTKQIQSPFATERAGTLPARSPLPSFAPPSISSTPISSSASSVALTAFLEAKRGQQMTAEDITVIETLTENMKAESHRGSPPREGKYGGWAAASYPSNLRPSQSMASLTSTPAKPTTAVFTTPGSGFSVGVDRTPGGVSQASPYRQRYLGPGMSPRRMYPQVKKSSIKPLFDFTSSDEDISGSKKRRVEDEVVGEPVPSSSLTSSVSMPSLSIASSAPIKSKSRLAAPSHTPARPSPLSQAAVDSPGSTTSTPGDSAASKRKAVEAAGKKRAAEILMNIIDEEIGPIVPTRKAEPVVFNPYDRTSLNPSPAPPVPSSTPSTSYAGATPRKASLKSQGSPAKRTPTRGAAAKLEAYKEAMKGSKPLTTIERIKGVRPWDNKISAGSSSPTSATETPDRDLRDIDELVDDDEKMEDSSAQASTSPAPVESTEPTPSAAARIPAPETFSAFTPPTVTFSSQPLPKSQPAPSIGDYDSPLRKSIIDASKAAPEDVPRPTFSFTPAPAVEQEKEEVPRQASSTPTPRLDLNAVYLSAKDSALKVAKPALPFFTFTFPPRPLDSTKSISDAVKTEALKRTAPKFDFTLSSSTDSVGSTSSSSSEKTIAPAATEWSCTLCGLKNAATVTDKCTICQEPKPKSASASAPAPGMFGFASTPAAGISTATEWSCSLCGLKNAASVTDKCTICQEPKPKTASAPAPTPSTAMFGFAPTPSAGASTASEWSCSLCGLKNAATVTDKCTICQEPKPKSTSTSASFGFTPASTATAVSTPPTTGGFAGFGQKKLEAGEWTCGLCGLKNPESAKEKCTICDTKR